ncbi:MAG TPA: large conductance mechanosensitive channel protein MscL [Acidimicrobiia bacterium]
MKQFYEDFKAFILRGNVLDLAVAVIIGAAFKAVIDSLVNDVITPLIGAVVGKPNFNDLVVNLRGCSGPATARICKGTVHYGNFLTQVTNFLIIGASIFVMIKAFERLQAIRRREEETGEVPVAVDEITLLTEIRDLLRKQEAQ